MEKAVTETAAHRAALLGEPIEKHGLKLWGITMRQYEGWAKCKNVWLARQATFPVSCMMMPFLDALFAMDTDAVDKVGLPLGYIHKIMMGLGMALGMDESCVRDGNILLKVNENEKKLEKIIIHTEEKTTEITSTQFDEIREIVAWMQGDSLPDESLNDELLETERELSERNTPSLKYDLMDMEASVALACNVRTREVMDWPILEFERIRRAIDRAKKHLICGIGATNGCKWDGGNPYPSWCFDRETDESNALVSASEFGKTKQNKKE